MCHNFKPSGKAWHVYMLENQKVLSNVRVFLNGQTQSSVVVIYWPRPWHTFHSHKITPLPGSS